MDGIDSSATDLQPIDTKAAAFETVNGESIAVFYNPNCRSDIDAGVNISKWGDHFYVQNRMCANFIYDLNGLKGPNKVGKDIGFITALYAKNSEVTAPIPFVKDINNVQNTQQEAVELCSNYSDDARLPNKHELSSMFYNMDLIGNFKTGHYWSSSIVSNERGWLQTFPNGYRSRLLRANAWYTRCVHK